MKKVKKEESEGLKALKEIEDIYKRILRGMKKWAPGFSIAFREHQDRIILALFEKMGEGDKPCDKD